MLIYKLTSPSGKFYIGKTTKTAEHRFRIHCASANAGSDAMIHKAIRKYGAENIVVETIELCSEETLSEREIFWIAELKADVRGIGYNGTKGGDGIDSETASRIKKEFWASEAGAERKLELSEQMSGANNFGAKVSTGKPSWNKGIVGVSEETSAKMAVAAEKRWTNEERARKGAGTKAMWEAGVFDNRPLPTEETKAKISATQTGHPPSDYQKQRASEVRSKTYIIHYFDGSSVTITGMSSYAKSSGIPAATLNYLLYNKKSSKKWNIKAIIEFENLSQ